VALAGAGAAEQHNRFTGVHVVPGGEVAERRRLDGGNGIDVEVGEPFQARELGVVDAAGVAAFCTVIDLGEVGQVRLAFPVDDAVLVPDHRLELRGHLMRTARRAVCDRSLSPSRYSV
jgi:hypothetical protein